MYLMDEVPIDPSAVESLSFATLGAGAVAILIVLAALAVAGAAIFLIIKAIRNKK